MGTYLSTPVTEKEKESGEILDCPVSSLSWSVVCMQGWRKSMEDAHVGQTDVPIPMHFLEQDNDEGACLRPKPKSAKIFGVFDGHGGPEVARFCQLYIIDALTKQQPWIEEAPVSSDGSDPSQSGVGQSLVGAFHALDRMIGDIPRREEIIRLRTEHPQPGELRSSDAIPIPPPRRFRETNPTNDRTDLKLSATESGLKNTGNNNNVAPKQQVLDESKESDPESEPDTTTNKSSTIGTKDSETSETIQDGKNDESKEDFVDEPTDSADASGLIKTASLSNGESNANDNKDEVPRTDTTKMTDNNNNPSPVAITVHTPVQTSNNNAASAYTTSASVIQNGRQICNLPDHPIHSGCTAVVAVLIGRTLTIANAGDSRAVLCRFGGRAEALSFDHKPHQDREMARITKAGGFVNQFGRVNGNLNLSRSIGDLKYKQVPGLKPSEQLITAEPDIVQVTLHPKDEFILLGCDGIWDCLTNEEAVRFVRERIDTKPPDEIGSEMLDQIISEDPRATQGIGGDNMTILIVDLLPHKRSYH